MTTRQQHYVWRKHLEAWENSTRHLYVSRKGKIFESSSKKIMRQRDFYSLARISRSDVNMLERLLSNSPQSLFESHQMLIRQFAVIGNTNHVAHKFGHLTQVDKKFISDISIEFEEKLQTQIEQEALPLLEHLRRENTNFLSDCSSVINFFRFLSHQYMRTKVIRNKIRTLFEDAPSGQDRGHLANIYCHCLADNIAYSLFVDRAQFEVIFLRTKSGDELITGDQPIVNLYLLDNEDSFTSELVFYFPLSPLLSLLLVPKDHKLTSLDAEPDIVEILNQHIVYESKEFLVANRKKILLELEPNDQNMPQHHGQRLIDKMKRQASH